MCHYVIIVPLHRVVLFTYNINPTSSYPTPNHPTPSYPSYPQRLQSENSGNLIPDHNVEKRSPSPQPQLSPLELVQQIASEANKLQEQVNTPLVVLSSCRYK